MPSRAKLEHLLHALAALALVAALAVALRALRGQPSAEVRGTASLEDALVRWSTGEAPQHAHVVFDSVPKAAARDWLAALRGVGTQPSWEGEGLTASGAAVEPIADPKRSARVAVAAPAGTQVAVHDAVGMLDTLRAGPSGGGRLIAASIAGSVHMSAGTAEAVAALRDSVLVRPVLVIGAAGWEGKFIVASLEEYGWTVDARLALSPKQIVVQGPPAPTIDTAHYAAVIAVDSVAAKYAAAIGAYVRSGGGFVAAGEAAGVPAFASLLPARAAETALDAGEFTSDSVPPRNALALRPLGALAPGAAVLERRDHDVAVAVHRVGMGRVVQVGYLDTWRWRLAARGDSALTAHRRWWSGIVSGAAYAPRFDRAGAADAVAAADPAPLAALAATLGPATPGREAVRGGWLDPRFLPLLFALIVAALMLEWASRRLRGAP